MQRWTSLLMSLAPVALFVGAPVPALGEEWNREQLIELASSQTADGLDLLAELLAIPNDAHFTDHIENNVAWSEVAFSARGFKTRRLETGGPPLLLAERAHPGAEHRVLVYLQLDGQPVDATEWWQEDPWKPVLAQEAVGGNWQVLPWSRAHGEERDPDWRVFARSASDAKGPVAMFLAALDVLAREGALPTVDLAVIMDFEEELGSPHVPDAVESYRQELAADALVIFDGPRHTSNRPTLTFGARGIGTVTLRVFGPRTPQHSGHWGNWAPNPAERLAALVASWKDASGRVVIPGFYDGVEIDAAARAVLAGVPETQDELLREIGVAAPYEVAETLQEAIQYPSLNLRGMRSAWVGDEVRTVIPASAVAELDLRLVPESDAERLMGLVRRWIEDQGYHLVHGEPTEDERRRYPLLASFEYEISYAAFRTPFESAVGRWLTSAMERAFGETPVRLRMAGGSIPISPFVDTVGLPAVSVPTVNPDNNQHSPNENLRLGNFEDGIRTILAILTEGF